jgi:hypothetical protein
MATNASGIEISPFHPDIRGRSRGPAPPHRRDAQGEELATMRELFSQEIRVAFTSLRDDRRSS